MLSFTFFASLASQLATTHAQPRSALPGNRPHFNELHLSLASTAEAQAQPPLSLGWCCLSCLLNPLRLNLNHSTSLHSLTMADDKAATTCLFTNLPLEVRHVIFEYAAVRDVKPKKLLRYWFEKKDVKERIAQHVAANPNGPTPQVIYEDNDYDEDSEATEDESEEQDENSADEDEDTQEEQDNNEEDDEMDQNDEEQEAEIDEDEDEDEDDGEDEEAMEEDQENQITTSAHLPVPAQAQIQDTIESDAEEQPGAEMDHDEEEPQTGAQDGGAESQDTQQVTEYDSDETIAEGNGDGDTTNSSTQPPPPPPPVPVPIFRAHGKWRHIPNFMRLTRCPPPVELLLTSTQLNQEVKNWYYDVAVLRVEATGSFAHTSFYEEAFSQITEAAFSPMENIRKVEVTFVWDTTWIRADTTGCVEAIFPALLRQRSNFVYQILMQAPDLREVVIHWHDSAQDNESANLRIDILEPFDNLPAAITIIEHYIDADAKPHNGSIAGKRRVEFQNIVDMGLDRLF
ncbi:hypothetical protein BKA66DRAFT_466287 [Pyrenochaeta sp. MPI-SDFR-AT-0127]|nr:hypothetical protein BKA66DRAFT_466287 [Pyrenochaeta sp. MPI-SDFR-AT-0127]